jgi:hypothetical protein
LRVGRDPRILSGAALAPRDTRVSCNPNRCCRLLRHSRSPTWRQCSHSFCGSQRTLVAARAAGRRLTAQSSTERSADYPPTAPALRGPPRSSSVCLLCGLRLDRSLVRFALRNTRDGNLVGRLFRRSARATGSGNRAALSPSPKRIVVSKPKLGQSIPTLDGKRHCFHQYEPGRQADSARVDSKLAAMIGVAARKISSLRSVVKTAPSIQRPGRGIPIRRLRRLSRRTHLSDRIPDGVGCPLRAETCRCRRVDKIKRSGPEYTEAADHSLLSTEWMSEFEN